MQMCTTLVMNRAGSASAHPCDLPILHHPPLVPGPLISLLPNVPGVPIFAPRGGRNRNFIAHKAGKKHGLEEGLIEAANKKSNELNPVEPQA